MKYLFVALFAFALFAGPAGAQTREEIWALCESGDAVRSIEACTTLIDSRAEIPRNLAIAHSNRGITYSNMGDFDKAIADYERALQLNPFLAAAMNSLAWDLATVPSEPLRDGRRAVEIAEKALAQNDEEPGFLDTAAAAYAEAGQFDAAVRVQEKAIAILRRADGVPAAVIGDFESRLRLYKNDQPFHRSQ